MNLMNREIENLLEDAAGSFVKHAGTGHWKVRFSMFFGRRKMDDLRTQLLQLVWNCKGRIRLISSEKPNENDPTLAARCTRWLRHDVRDDAWHIQHHPQHLLMA